MKDKNRIDEFFAKSFDEMSQIEDPSLMPPESVWEGAKSQFPKKKKKRRFIWLFLVSAMIALFATLYQLNLEKEPSEIIAQEEIKLNSLDSRFLSMSLAASVASIFLRERLTSGKPARKVRLHFLGKLHCGQGLPAGACSTV